MHGFSPNYPKYLSQRSILSNPFWAFQLLLSLHWLATCFPALWESLEQTWLEVSRVQKLFQVAFKKSEISQQAQARKPKFTIFTYRILQTWHWILKASKLESWTFEHLTSQSARCRCCQHALRTHNVTGEGPFHGSFKAPRSPTKHGEDHQHAAWTAETWTIWTILDHHFHDFKQGLGKPWGLNRQTPAWLIPFIFWGWHIRVKNSKQNQCVSWLAWLSDMQTSDIWSLRILFEFVLLKSNLSKLRFWSQIGVETTNRHIDWLTLNTGWSRLAPQTWTRWLKDQGSASQQKGDGNDRNQIDFMQIHGVAQGSPDDTFAQLWFSYDTLLATSKLYDTPGSWFGEPFATQNSAHIAAAISARWIRPR